MTEQPFEPYLEVSEEQRSKTLQELEGQDWGEPSPEDLRQALLVFQHP